MEINTLLLDACDILFEYRKFKEKLLEILPKYGIHFRDSKSLMYVWEAVVQAAFLPNTQYETPMEEFFDRLGIASKYAEAKSILTEDDFETEVKDGVIEGLSKLKSAGIELIVLSDSEDSIKETLIEHSIMNYIDKIYASYNTGLRKPDPRAYLNALNRNCIENSGFVGHALDELLGAKATGLITFAVDPEAGEELILAHGISREYIVSNLKELADLIIDK